MLGLVVLAVLAVSANAQSSVTCDGLGSFTDDAPFNNLPVPHCPEDLGNDLHLEYYSPDNPNVPQSIVGTDRTTIPNDWSSSRDTIFVSHGWTNDIDTGWLEGFKDAHLANLDVNVVNVGWGGPFGAGDINYQWSASTTRTIGAHIAEVTENLITNGGASANSFQFIGHSLGAHVSGHAGRWASEKHGRNIGRITGMDPAGPEFVSVSDRTIGLWTDCGDFVDSMNTDNTYGSTPTNTGHANYYPNGGRDQPGCETIEGVCSHGRALDLYEESLYFNTCEFNARQTCSNTGNLPGSCSACSGVCGAMGYSAKDYGRQDFYLTTNSNSPFCEG